MAELQAYLLAGGDGARAGGPKAWREFEGRSLLERQLDFLLKRLEPEAVAVSIQEAWRDRCRALHAGVRWVAEDPKNRPMGALRALIQAAPLTRWAYLYHVDMPVWEPALFDALAARVPSAEKAGMEAVAPAFEGRKGHPVLLSPSLAPAIAALDPARDRLDFWLRTRKEDVVDVPFACVHDNWNGPGA